MNKRMSFDVKVASYRNPKTRRIDWPLVLVECVVGFAVGAWLGGFLSL